MVMVFDASAELFRTPANSSGDVGLNRFIYCNIAIIAGTIHSIEVRDLESPILLETSYSGEGSAQLDVCSETTWNF